MPRSNSPTYAPVDHRSGWSTHDTHPKTDPHVVAPVRCESCAVRNTSICGALSFEELTELNAISRRKTLRAGETYSMEGDRINEFANIERGVVKLVRGAEDGRSQIVGLLFESDFLGDFGKQDEALEQPNSIEAVTDLNLCVFPKERFEALLERFPTLEHRLLRRAFDELKVAQNWMVLLGRKTAEERVASFLLHVTEKMQNRGCHRTESFDLPINRSDIADYIGLTIETVSRQITKLRKDGVIVLEGTKHVVSVDHERLQERAGF